MLNNAQHFHDCKMENALETWGTQVLVNQDLDKTQYI